MAHEDGRARSGTGPEPSPSLNAASQAVAGSHKIAIRRTGRSVEITLTSNNEYASIELYDSLVQSVEKGFLRIELKLPRS